MNENRTSADRCHSVRGGLQQIRLRCWCETRTVPSPAHRSPARAEALLAWQAEQGVIKTMQMCNKDFKPVRGAFVLADADPDESDGIAEERLAKVLANESLSYGLRMCHDGCEAGAGSRLPSHAAESLVSASSGVVRARLSRGPPHPLQLQGSALRCVRHRLRARAAARMPGPSPLRSLSRCCCGVSLSPHLVLPRTY